MNPLRLALFELFEEGAAPHGVVDAAVGLVPKSKAGLTNAVLRNVLRREIDWNTLPVPQTPKWLRKRLLKAWGKAAVEAMEAVQAARPPLDITLRDPDETNLWASELGATILPGGSLRLTEARQVSTLPGFDEGAWWVQDAGATVAVRAMGAIAGMRVLDLCAAPGGKAMQLASAGAQVTALDISEKRLDRLRENLARTHLAAEIVVADALEWGPDAPFDVILLDAPCSATGTLRRHPDLAYARDGTGIEPLIELQAGLIDRAVGWLGPNGRLVYCTCSLLPEEGERQIEAALVRHPDFSVQATDFPGLDPAWPVPTGLRLRPDQWAESGGIDGFFVSVLQKRP